MPSDPNDEPEGREPSDGANYPSGQPRFDLRSAFIARQEQLLADLGLSLDPPWFGGGGRAGGNGQGWVLLLGWLRGSAVGLVGMDQGWSCPAEGGLWLSSACRPAISSGRGWLSRVPAARAGG